MNEGWQIDPALSGVEDGAFGRNGPGVHARQEGRCLVRAQPPAVIAERRAGTQRTNDALIFGARLPRSTGQPSHEVPDRDKDAVAR